MSAQHHHQNSHPTNSWPPPSTHPSPPTHQPRRYNTRQSSARHRLEASEANHSLNYARQPTSLDVNDTASSSLTPLPAQDIVPPSSPRLPSLDRELGNLAFGSFPVQSTPVSLQHRHRVSCSVASASEPGPLLADLFTSPAADRGNLGAAHLQGIRVGSSIEPPAAQPRCNPSPPDRPVYDQIEGAQLAVSREDALHVDADDGKHDNTYILEESRPFAQNSALQDLFEESQDGEEPEDTNLAPVLSLFKISNYSLRRRRKHRHSQARGVINPDLDNCPRLTFTARSTPSPSKKAQPRKPATNKSVKAYSHRRKQLQTFPARLKQIKRSPLKSKRNSQKGVQDGQLDIEFGHREAVRLLSQLKRRHQSPGTSQVKRPQMHWPFTPYEEREAIQTPALPPSPKRDGRSRNAEAYRLHFVRNPATPPPNAPTPPPLSRVPNSYPSQHPLEPSSTATRNIASLCGTASLRRYNLPSPPSMPSGISEPPPLDVDQEIEMWEEEERSSRQREVTPPDDITADMASWGDVPDENQPLCTQNPSSNNRTATPRQVLADITRQFVPAPAPSMSGVDLTAHLMSLVDSLEPVRVAPRRRRHAVPKSEFTQPPHRNVRSSSFTARTRDNRRTETVTQPVPAKRTSGSQLVLRSSSAPGRKSDLTASDTENRLVSVTQGGRAVGHSANLPEQPPLTEEHNAEAQNSLRAAHTPSSPRGPQRIDSRRSSSGTVWSEFKQPTRVDATPLPEPSEVDLRHAELAEKFASFAAYVKQHEKPVRPPPVLGTRVRPLSLRGTKSLGHTSSHRLPGQGRYSATQGPIR